MWSRLYWSHCAVASRKESIRTKEEMKHDPQYSSVRQHTTPFVSYRHGKSAVKSVCSFNWLDLTQFLAAPMSPFCRSLVGANTVTDTIVFVYGPCPASASEVVMVQRSGILEAIPRDSKMIADGGFRGFDTIAILYRWGEVRADKDLESRVQ